jgi:hypothetical protein
MYCTDNPMEGISCLEIAKNPSIRVIRKNYSECKDQLKKTILAFESLELAEVLGIIATLHDCK